ncbi:MAG: gamma-glutamyltransferase, partial [Alphaproteobacteria bacterium]|nr:gamma-glutamyltransferase [Alphaproteobacteria bacterium]
MALGACDFGSGETPEWLAQFEKPKEAARDVATPRLAASNEDGFFGAVVADEPLAALAARNVLASGGTAADAAVALYFSLAVTYPSAASLGGGGVCVVHDWENQQVAVLDFLQPLASTSDSQAGLVPGNVGGMAALHLRFREKDWADLITPAEEYAKNGIRVSKALAEELAKHSGRLLSSMESRHLFANYEGTVLAEGDRLHQFELASTLKYIRTLGPSAFYRGTLARKLTGESAARGGAVDHAGLDNFRAKWRPPLAVKYGEDTLYTAGSTGGRIIVRMWEMLTREDRYKSASAEEKAHLFAEIAMRAFAGANTKGNRQGWMDDFDPQKHTPVEQLSFAPVAFPDNQATTSYAIVDRKGLAITCSHTMNRPFGTAAIVPGTGIFFAAPTESGHDVALAPVLVMRDVGKTRLSEKKEPQEFALLETQGADPLD